MIHTRHVNMRAVFYGGPCDGAELTLPEPIRTVIRLPARDDDPAAALSHVPAVYHLALATPDTPYRDRRGRVRYVYEVPKPQPKGSTDE